MSLTGRTGRRRMAASRAHRVNRPKPSRLATCLRSNGQGHRRQSPPSRGCGPKPAGLECLDRPLKIFLVCPRSRPLKGVIRFGAGQCGREAAPAAWGLTGPASREALANGGDASARTRPRRVTRPSGTTTGPPHHGLERAQVAQEAKPRPRRCGTQGTEKPHTGRRVTGSHYPRIGDPASPCPSLPKRGPSGRASNDARALGSRIAKTSRLWHLARRCPTPPK